MLRRLILYIGLNALTLYFMVQYLGGDLMITGGLKGYVVTAVIFGILNSLVKPILKIVALPFYLITAGLFSIVINTGLVWFAKYALDILKFEGVALVIQGGIGTYLTIGILFSVINLLMHWLIKSA